MAAHIAVADNMAEDPVEAALRAELGALKVNELRKRVLSAGVRAWGRRRWRMRWTLMSRRWR